MGIWSRSGEHLGLMKEMFSRAGALDTPFVSANDESALRNAMFRCLSCKSTEECRKWLDANADGAAPPAFCANVGLINSHRRAA